jgi:hypothetical protein
MTRILSLRPFAFLLCIWVTVPEAHIAGQITPLDAGTISGNSYHNSELGFRYQFPSDWVVNETAAQEREIKVGHQIAWEDATSTKLGKDVRSRCARNLLFVTQHPAAMQMNGFNSSVFLIAVDPKCVPGVSFPTSVKDHEAIQRIAKQVVNHLKMSTVTDKGPVQLRAFDNAGRVMVQISQAFDIFISEPAGSTTQNIHTSILLMQAGQYWVLWRFATDTDYNLKKLEATKVFFDAETAEVK